MARVRVMMLGAIAAVVGVGVAVAGCKGAGTGTGTAAGTGTGTAAGTGSGTGTGSGSGSGSGSGAGAAAEKGVTRVVTTLDETAQLVEVGTTVKTIATVKLPETVQDVVWVGKEPLVLLAAQDHGMPVDGKDNGTVGAITEHGFVPVDVPAAWDAPHDAGATRMGPFWKLEAAANGEAWLGRCEWGGIEDGGHCDTWVWARLGGPVKLTALQPPPEVDERPWPKIAAAPGYTITFSPSPSEDQLSVLHCTGGGKTLAFPTDDKDSPVDPASLRWVSTDPPLFVIDQVVNGYEPTSEPTAFEGCVRSDTFGEVLGVAGPAGLFALASSGAVSLRRDGKELARLPGADHVVFAPDPDATGAVELAVLEKQLAGDTSMFAPDAIVLAPAPVPAKGVRLVPAGMTAARIASFTTGDAGDATWFAAELELTTGPATHTYRAVEVLDAKTDRVLVASFAPLAKLARVAAAPAMPAPTAAGPLAPLLAAPARAAAALPTGSVVVFGTDPGEHATYANDAKKLLGTWGKLTLALDPQVHEVRAASWGYAIGTVTLARPGGGPVRMSALVVATPDKAGAWQPIAIHYLAL